MATERDPLETRRRLLAAALDEFVERGYVGAKVATIARRADLTTGAIYTHFAGKGDLLLQALLFSGSDRLSRLTGALTVDEIAQLLVEPPAGYHRLVLELFAAATRDEDAGAAVGANLDDAHRELVARLRGNVESGRFDPTLDAEAAAHVFELMLLGTICAKALGRPLPSIDGLGEVLTRLLAGLERP